MVLAECGFDRQVALDVVARWGWKWRFSFGPANKDCSDGVGPRRCVPSCSLHLGDVLFSVVTEYCYFGVILTPTLSCHGLPTSVIWSHGVIVFSPNVSRGAEEKDFPDVLPPPS